MGTEVTDCLFNLQPRLADDQIAQELNKKPATIHPMGSVTKRCFARTWRNGMKQIICPKCRGSEVRHYTDAYVLRVPIIKEDGSVDLLDDQTNEYDDRFFECLDCGYKPTEDELLSAAI